MVVEVVVVCRTVEENVLVFVKKKYNNAEGFLKKTYIIVVFFFWQRNVSDSVSDIPLHAWGTITQVTVSTEISSLNNTVMTIAPHCYPRCMIL